MQKITCRCDNVVEVDAQDILDLDAGPYSVEKLARGESPSQICAKCGATVRGALPCHVISKANKIDILVLPEDDRILLYRGKAETKKAEEVLVGYAELFERARCIHGKLDPRTVEIMKYNLQLKAEESAPETAVPLVQYYSLTGDALEFHISGIQVNQVGVIKLPRALYEKIAADIKSLTSKNPYKEIFAGQYRSIRKLGFLDSMKG